MCHDLFMLLKVGDHVRWHCTEGFYRGLVTSIDDSSNRVVRVEGVSINGLVGCIHWIDRPTDIEYAFTGYPRMNIANVGEIQDDY